MRFFFCVFKKLTEIFTHILIEGEGGMGVGKNSKRVALKLTSSEDCKVAKPLISFHFSFSFLFFLFLANEKLKLC